jgi:adenosine deaminase
MFQPRNRFLAMLPWLLCAWLATATAPAQAQTPGEQRAIRAFDAAKRAGPPELYAFLAPMPKGADLHMHLSGAVYAETFLREAVTMGLCVDKAALKLTQPLPNAGGCAAGLVAASTVLTDQALYDALVDSFSMRGFVPTPGVTGHDQFFATFDRFGAAKNPGEWLDEVAARAAAQNEQYLEIMQTPPFSNAAKLGYQIGWPAGAEKEIRSDQLAALRSQLLSGGLKSEVATDLKALDDAKASRSEIEHCDVYERNKDRTAADMPSHGAIMEMEEVRPGCSVQIHWIYQILRANPPQQVFAQTLLGFEVVAAAMAADPAAPDVVGINFVQPEDARLAMQDYHLQMQMLDYLHSVYPKVKISLHAGELAPGMVPYEGMSFHIREAVELGHASRIGHGVDVLYEAGNAESPVTADALVTAKLEPLLKEMAAKHVMVEVNLTSNDVILGIKGKEHPLAAYRAAHVPVALSTDDEGVSRIDLTHEYVKGVEEQGLGYLDLKQMARTSLEHAFLAGESLWAAPDDFAHRRPVCAGPVTAGAKPAAACEAFLKANERAREQYELERRFVVFEAGAH